MRDCKKTAARYYVALRPKTNDLHTVHSEGCPFMPEDNKKIYLGEYSSGEDALHEGKKHFSASIVCRFCSHDHYDDKREPELTVIENSSYIPTESQLSLSQNGGLYYFLN